MTMELAPDILGHGVDVIRRIPLNGETPPAALTAPVTPTAHVYVRTNFGVPAIDGRTHRIDVTGAVGAPLSVGVADLEALEQTTSLVTMECAGNDRTKIIPPVGGEPWTGGAVSTVRWSGVPLCTILDRARPDPRAVAVLFEGADRGHVESIGQPISFARSLPLSDALHPDTLLATAMNGEPLPPRYGAPVRLVVPGWFGMASVKWLRRIEVLTSPFEGYFQTQRYVYTDGHSSTPVTRMRVKSLIADPVSRSTIVPGSTRISGWAWSGDAPIVGVDVSQGDSGEWHPARLHAPESASAWVRWEIELELRGSGSRDLRSRARDAAGNIQPAQPPWNELGYGNNAIRATRVYLAPA
jgi:DMSO/TMAO reductase YedYZ molybdopterin-dependent catalytic subunit